MENVADPTPNSAEPADAIVLRRVPGWILIALGAALPTLLAISRAYVLARGDAGVAGEVLRRIDLVSFLSATVVLTLSTGALPALFAVYRFLLFQRQGPADARRHLPDGIYHPAMVAAFVFGALVTHDWRFPASALLAVAGIEQLTRRTSRREPGRTVKALRVLALLQLPVVVATNAAWTPWPTPEVVRVGTGPVEWVYVLVVEDTHTTVLHPAGGLERVANSEGIERAVCPDRQISSGTPGWHPSLLQLLLDSDDSTVPELCASAPSPPRFPR